MHSRGAKGVRQNSQKVKLFIEEGILISCSDEDSLLLNLSLNLEILRQFERSKI